MLDRARWTHPLLCFLVYPVAILMGCGSSGSGSPTPLPPVGDGSVQLPDGFAGDAKFAPIPEVPLNGTVVLPTGYSGRVETLRAITLLGDVPLDAQGKFALTGAGNGRQGMMVVDADGDLVLIGWGKKGTESKLSTTTTAAFYLFLYAGVPFMPVAAWDKLAEALLVAPQTAQFAAFLDEKLAVNPKFLALATQADKKIFAEKMAKTLATFLPKTEATSQGLVLVNPSYEKSGVTVLVGDKDGNANADVNQITLMQQLRRRAWVFVDRKVGESYSAETNFELPPTNGLNGTIGSIVDVINDKGAYTPIYYGPISLGSVATEDEILTYRIRVVGNGVPKTAGTVLTPEQLSQRKFIGVKSLLADFFMPAFCSFMNFDFLGDMMNSPFFAEFVKEIVNNAYNGNLIDVGNLLTNGDYWGAVTSFANTLQNNGTYRAWFLEQFRIYVMLKLFGNEKAWRFSLEFSKALLKAMEVVDAALAIADLYAVARDTTKANEVEDWEVLVKAPKVIITPAVSKLSCGEKGALDVVVKNAGQKLEKNLYYKFENTARYGHLTTALNSTYKDNFEVTKPTVFYEVNPGTFPEGATDTITVEVHMSTDDPKGGTKQVKQAIGKAKATVQLSAICTSTRGYVGSGAYTSGCTAALSAPAVVRPGDEVTVTVKSGYGGVCGTSYVGMSYAVSAKLDGGPATTKPFSGAVYDFCYGGDPQPVIPSGVAVDLPDGETHTVTFKIDDRIQCSVCVKEVLNGAPCSSNAGNRQNLHGPAVVNGGNGGTHGWSTVRFFTVDASAVKPTGAP